MKKEVIGENAISGRTVDLTGTAQEILKTLVHFERNYGVSYLVKFLTGDETIQWKDEKHKQIETYGALKDRTPENVKNVIHYLSEIDLLGPANFSASIIGITEKGKQYLDKPEPIFTYPNKIRLGKLDYFLKNRLLQMRTRRANETGKATYEVLSDWSIERILRERPVTIPELRKIAGFTHEKVETLGEKILSQVKEVNEIRMQETMNFYRQAVKGNLAQNVKKMFLNGTGVQEMADELGLTVNGIQVQLERLHMTGEIDMRPWIEQNMDKKALFTGAEYFRKVHSPRMKDAYESLGLDYSLLRLCRLYVADVSKGHDQVLLSA